MYISGNDRSIKKTLEYNILKYCSKNLCGICIPLLNLTSNMMILLLRQEHCVCWCFHTSER